VEIPDAAVEAAHAKYYEGAYQFLQSASRTAMRAALVAARPYLMPTREEIERRLVELINDATDRPDRPHTAHGNHGYYAFCAICSGKADEIASALAPGVEALLNGES
jgi:hypothetical protein